MAQKGGKFDASGQPIGSWRLVTDTDADTGIGSQQDPVRVDPTGTTVQPVSFSSPQHVIIDSGGSGGGAVTVADGANVTQGALADVAVTSDVNGTLSAKLRGLVKILSDVWDSVNHRLKIDGSGVTQPISGAVSVSNFPATQPVSGTVSLTATHTSVRSTSTGAQQTITVPGATKYLLMGGYLELDCSATVATRMIVLDVKDASGNVIATIVPSPTFTASQAGAMTFGPGVAAQTTAVINNFTWPLPKLALGASFTVVTRIQNLQATDVVILNINVISTPA